MIKKGWRRVEDPEKMPVITHGIEMSRGARGQASKTERLTGGNAAADESQSARLVMDFILKTTTHD